MHKYNMFRGFTMTFADSKMSAVASLASSTLEPDMLDEKVAQMHALLDDWYRKWTTSLALEPIRSNDRYDSQTSVCVALTCVSLQAIAPRRERRAQLSLRQTAPGRLRHAFH